ncbi:MAG: beta strand repeat-containing protein, partial [Rhodoluna sp.]
MTINSLNSKVVRAGAILSALLMVLLPSTGVGNFATAAYAVSGDQDTSLSTFTVDGTSVTNGSEVNVDYGTDSVDVVAIPTNVDATVDISGDTNLENGSNTLSVVVTAADDVTTETYTVTVNVGANDDASLGVFTVNGDDVANGQTVNLAFGTTEVEVIAEPTDVEATVVISGDSGLETGNNTLQVIVTAADNSTTQTYSVTLRVAENDDATLSVFAINGDDVEDGATLNLDYGTSEVEVIAEASDPEATLVVAGNKDFGTGTSSLTVTVTAADGTTVRVYTVTLVVAQNDDASLSVFSVNGEDVIDGGIVTVAHGTTSVTVIADSADPNAVVEITGSTGLSVGNNTLKAEVTAANGVAKRTYTVTVVVSGPTFSNDVTLKTFKVDGKTVSDGGSVRIALGRTTVSVEAVPNDVYATAVVSGNTGLVTGDNEVSVTVTADDGTVKVYKVTVVVTAPSSDTSLSSVKIDDNSFNVAEDGSSEYAVPFGTSKVVVAAVATSGYATVAVTGDTGLSVGSNNLNIRVTAEDGSYKDYGFKVVVASPNSNTSLASLKINGSSALSGDVIELAYGTTEVSVETTATATTSTTTVTGGSALTTGNNTLTVRVTAQSGAYQDYSVTLKVLAASSVKTISGITVNGLAVTDNTVSLTAGTKTANVVVSLVSQFASYTVSGGTSVSTGSNSKTITVTAQDGSTAETVLTINVEAPSTDNSLLGVTVDGVALPDLTSVVSRPFGTSSVVVVASANSAKATVVVSGEDVLVPGLNTVTITVTAESGAAASYTFTVNVAKSSNTGVSSILADNTEVSVSKALTVGFGATSVEVSAVTSDPEATYQVFGNSGLQLGANDVTVTVTAADGVSTKSYVIVVTVPSASTDNSLLGVTVDGVALPDLTSVVSKPFGTSSVVVVASANSAKATVVVSGEDVLVPGLNTVTITVTA